MSSTLDLLILMYSCLEITFSCVITNFLLHVDITTDVDTDIEAVRLINGEENINSGRLEVLYNGTWGTICNNFWSYSDAKVACR